MEHAKLKWHMALYVSLLALLFARIAVGCDQPSAIREATPEEIRSFFEARKMKVLTFLGYSAAEYENKAAMLKQATRILDEFDPRATIVNIGATPEGMGAVYEVAKRKGFLTTGIVSTQAKENNVKLSPCVDVVFYVRDATWGGFTPGTERLSPTSTAMVENSDVIVAIGGGEVSRDELIAARRLGKNTQFVPAEMNRGIARERARKRGQPAPTDFRGAAGAVF
jgi:predicted Rossmann-fold nucleotide-binding protein